MKSLTVFSPQRRLALALPGLLLACSGAPTAAPTAAPVPSAPGAVTLSHWRTVSGGVVSPAASSAATPGRPGAGAFAKLVSPTAVALLDDEVLVADSATQRVWRADLRFNTLTALPGAIVTPGTALALAPDQSAWVLEGAAGQARRFARDGRVLQTILFGSDAAAPMGIALTDAGSTLLVADGGLRQWLEYRTVGAFAAHVRPQGAEGRLSGVDAIAVGGGFLWLLDRSAGAVNKVNRSGQLQATLGAGWLKQPVALAVDRVGRAWVLDVQDHSVKLLREGRPMQVFDAASLRVQQPFALAVSEGFLAVADRLGGQVVVYRVQETRP